jgi:hypothetical protein
MRQVRLCAVPSCHAVGLLTRYCAPAGPHVDAPHTLAWLRQVIGPLRDQRSGPHGGIVEAGISGLVRVISCDPVQMQRQRELSQCFGRTVNVNGKRIMPSFYSRWVGMPRGRLAVLGIEVFPRLKRRV